MTQAAPVAALQTAEDESGAQGLGANGGDDECYDILLIKSPCLLTGAPKYGEWIILLLLV